MFEFINIIAMNILEKIVLEKRKEVDQRKLVFENSFISMPGYNRKCRSMVQSILETEPSIIAEFKRKSPSKGWIRKEAQALEIVAGYEAGGAAGISILTDEYFFGGSSDDLILASDILNIPILRKDFIIDEYQVFESKAFGADVILLIAACLTKELVQQFARVAKDLGLEVLLEIHNDEELSHICAEVDLVGVNNRDLKTFKVDINHSIELASKVPADKILISESGLRDASDIVLLQKHGFKGFLIGEKFMIKQDPGRALQNFIDEIKAKDEN